MKGPRPGSGGCRGEGVRVSRRRTAVPPLRPGRRRWSRRSCVAPVADLGGLSNLIPAGSPAAQADADAARLFGYPLEAGVAIVQRDPRGLPSAAVNRHGPGRAGIRRPPRHPRPDRRHPDTERGGPPLDRRLAGFRGQPARRGQQEHLDDRHIPRLQPRRDHAAAGDGRRHVRARYLADVVGVTGPVAAQYEQGLIIDRDLDWVELFTVLAIAVIVGVRPGRCSRR